MPALATTLLLPLLAITARPQPLPAEAAYEVCELGLAEALHRPPAREPRLRELCFEQGTCLRALPVLGALDAGAVQGELRPVLDALLQYQAAAGILDAEDPVGGFGPAARAGAELGPAPKWLLACEVRACLDERRGTACTGAIGLELAAGRGARFGLHVEVGEAGAALGLGWTGSW